MIIDKLTKIHSVEKAYWFIVRKDEIWFEREAPYVPLASFAEMFLSGDVKKIICLGEHNGLPVYSVNSNSVALCPELNGDFIDLRQVITECEFTLFGFAAKSIQFQHFVETHKFCGRCGNKMKPVGWELANQCQKCNHRCYPRLSPCVIMAVTDGDKLLLARDKKSRSGRYSILAGFVEPGETLEHAVAREVFEETGLDVGNIKYFSSQPWPFPHQIMVGFTAEYIAGEINVDTRELIDAKWFEISDLPETPGKYSIAGQLIEYVSKNKKALHK